MFPVHARTIGHSSAFLAGLDGCACGCNSCGTSGLGYSPADAQRDLMTQNASRAQPLQVDKMIAWSANAGAGLKKAVDNDPAVKVAIASVKGSVTQYNMTLSQAKKHCGPDYNNCEMWGRGRPRRCLRYGKDMMCESTKMAAIHRLNSILASINATKSQLQNMREMTMQRITMAIPYKGHVIKPKLEGNDVWYHVTFNISQKQGKYREPQEAKAAIDNEIALGPGGLAKKEEFESLAKKVGEAKAAEVIKTKEASDKAAVAMAAEMPKAPVKQPWSTKKKVLVGGAALAAVAGAFMVMR